MGNLKQQFTRRLFVGDNLAVMRGLESESADLIYLDPPFNSKRIYEGNLPAKIGKQRFKDIWRMADIPAGEKKLLDALNPDAAALIDVLGKSHGESWRAYLTFMAVRLDEMRRLLKPAGSVYLHCDSAMSAPLKLLMDIVFGKNNFRNEIIWHYSKGNPPRNKFKPKTDNILFYVKSAEAVFNRQRMPYTYADPREFRFNDGAGRVYRENRKKDKHGNPKRFYLDEGTPMDNMWTYLRDKEFNQINSNSPERTGWATQKPLALLERIIKTSSNGGGLVLDPFCGCATACIAAERLGRQWIGIDIDPAAAKILQSRVEGENGGKKKAADRNILDWRDVEVINARAARNLPKRSGGGTPPVCVPAPERGNGDAGFGFSAKKAYNGGVIQKRDN